MTDDVPPGYARDDYGVFTPVSLLDVLHRLTVTVTDDGTIEAAGVVTDDDLVTLWRYPHHVRRLRDPHWPRWVTRTPAPVPAPVPGRRARRGRVRGAPGDGVTGGGLW